MSWTEDEARRHLAEFERSGLTLVAFCDRLGVSTQRMSYWRDRLRRRGQIEPGPLPRLPQLIEVAVRPSAATTGGSIVVEFPTGHVVRVPAAVGLAEVLRAAGLVAC